MVGNAVTVNVVKEIMLKLLKTKNEKRKKSLC